MQNETLRHRVSMLLARLQAGEWLTSSSISRELGANAGALTAILHKMAERGQVEREVRKVLESDGRERPRFFYRASNGPKRKHKRGADLSDAVRVLTAKAADALAAGEWDAVIGYCAALKRLGGRP